MADLLHALILGIVQGLTEFLPVSSTGHLVLTQELFGVSQERFGLPFDAAIHLGTLASVLVYFRATVRRLVYAWLASVARLSWRHTQESRLAWLLLLGTVPAAIAGVLIEDLVEEQFRAAELVALMLIVFCLPMLLAERFGARRRVLEELRVKDALLIGAAQSVALIPGVSRSGITISAGMLAGFRREEAASFAFLLSAPVIAGAGGKQVIDILRERATSVADLDVYVVGLLSAAVVGYLAVAFLMRFLRTNSLLPFVVYRVLLGVTVLGVAGLV